MLGPPAPFKPLILAWHPVEQSYDFLFAVDVKGVVSEKGPDSAHYNME